MKAATSQLVVETLAGRSGVAFIAHEISDLLRSVYNREASPKSVSQSLIVLVEDYDMISKRGTTNHERGLYGCRYIYLWGRFDPKTGEVA
jgi:hypothetical protein